MDEHTSGTDEALLYELALRLATFPGDPRIDNPRLLVGALPPNLSGDTPVPEGSRILGSLIRSPEHIDIELDCALSPEDVLQFYRGRLLSAGWSELESMRSPNTGFVTTHMFALQNHIVFCHGSHGPAFAVHARPGAQGRTDVRLNVNADSEYSPCAQQNRRQRMHRGMHDLIPTLIPPQGAKQQGGGGSGGTGSWYTSATLQTDMDIPELAGHYHT